jgi:hypothetical protein
MRYCNKKAIAIIALCCASTMASAQAQRTAERQAISDSCWSWGNTNPWLSVFAGPVKAIACIATDQTQGQTQYGSNTVSARTIVTEQWGTYQVTTGGSLTTIQNTANPDK